MKLLVIACLLFASIPSWAFKCTIDFENEIAANPLLHSLFKHIKNNVSILNNKGYKLVSAVTGNPTHVGFIMADDVDPIMEIHVHNFVSPNVWVSDVKRTNDRSNVITLLKRIPPCH